MLRAREAEVRIMRGMRVMSPRQLEQKILMERRSERTAENVKLLQKAVLAVLLKIA